jgi:hypothetical protein
VLQEEEEENAGGRGRVNVRGGHKRSAYPLACQSLDETKTARQGFVK